MTLMLFVNFSYSQNVGIGTIDPQANLDVAGSTKTTTLQVTDGAGANKILQSDGLGNATWVTSPVPNINYYNLTSSSVFTSTFSYYVNISDLIVTPIAGTYYVSSILNYSCSSAPNISFALSINGNVISNTEFTGINETERSTISIQGIVTVNGTQTVSTVCRRFQGDPINITNRSMVLIRLN